MTPERNPQAEQMAHESMLRTLATQADAIWPAESALLARYGLAGPLDIADIGCGSGEITARLALYYPEARLIGRYPAGLHRQCPPSARGPRPARPLRARRRFPARAPER